MVSIHVYDMNPNNKKKIMGNYLNNSLDKHVILDISIKPIMI